MTHEAGIWIFGFIALWAVAVFAFVRGSRGRDDVDTFTADPDGWYQPFHYVDLHDVDMPEFPGEYARPIGWQPWEGGECPVPDDTDVKIMLMDGTIRRALARRVFWQDDGSLYAVVAYRIAD